MFEPIDMALLLFIIQALHVPDDEADKTPSRRNPARLATMRIREVEAGVPVGTLHTGPASPSTDALTRCDTGFFLAVPGGPCLSVSESVIYRHFDSVGR